jgi:uncharacterized protein YjbI with pentapeptide repeats
MITMAYLAGIWLARKNDREAELRAKYSDAVRFVAERLAGVDLRGCNLAGADLSDAYLEVRT